MFTFEEKQAISLIIMGVLTVDDIVDVEIQYLSKVERVISYPKADIMNSLRYITKEKALYTVRMMSDTNKAILSMLLFEAVNADGKITKEEEAFLNYIEGACSLTEAANRAINSGFKWNCYE